MKHLSIFVLLASVVIGSSSSRALADVSVGVATDRWAVQWRDHDRPVRYAPRAYYPRHQAVRHYRRPYYSAHRYPVVVPQPQAGPTLSGDYGRDLATLNERRSRLWAILKRQKERSGITDAQAQRFSNALDQIEHDQHARAFDRGGNLRSEDFADLFRRLDQVDEDMELALAQ